MNIDDLSKVLYPYFKAAFNCIYGANMTLTTRTRINMILLSVDMIARGEY